ncbi:hypothetical protein Q5752_005175 [Cryptotrichosporon argae]
MTFTLDDLPSGTSTPPDYTRLHFDPSCVPAKRIVGLLACQRNPLLRTLRTTVLAVRPAKALPVQKGREKQKKDKGEATPTASGALWEVEVNDTVIFPEGGGQPSDTGSITVTTPNGNVTYAVESCIRRKLDSIHFVRAPEGSDLADLVGQDVELEVDWRRRMDHMATHTGQHLLSAVLDTMALPTLSWAMPAHPSLEAPYVELPRALTWAEAEEVERQCNEAIWADKRVWIDVVVQGDEGAQGEMGARETKDIPKDYAGGVIRHCNIDGIDRNACCGTQCPSLALVTALHVVPPSTPSTSTTPNQTATRLFFVAGPRALGYLRHASRQLSLAAQAIAVSRADLVDRLAKFEAARHDAADREKGLRAELVKVVADMLVVHAAESDNKVIVVERAERGTHDFEFLGQLALAVANAHKDRAVVVVSTAASPALLLVQSAGADLAKTVNDKVKAALDEGGKGRVKGGGAKGRFMSKFEWAKGDAERLRAIADA